MEAQVSESLSIGDVVLCEYAGDIVWGKVLDIRPTDSSIGYFVEILSGERLWYSSEQMKDGTLYH